MAVETCRVLSVSREKLKPAGAADGAELVQHPGSGAHLQVAGKLRHVVPGAGCLPIGGVAPLWGRRGRLTGIFSERDVLRAQRGQHFALAGTGDRC